MSLFGEGMASGPYVIAVPEMETWNDIWTYADDASWRGEATKGARLTYVRFPDEAEN